MIKRGFTIIELIISMVLVSILGAFLSGILSRSVQSYTAASSRVTIGESLATAFDTLNFDLKNVLPNSTRVTNSGSTFAVEFFNVAYGPFPYRNFAVGSSGSAYTPSCAGSCLTSCQATQTSCNTSCQGVLSLHPQQCIETFGMPCWMVRDNCVNDCTTAFNTCVSKGTFNAVGSSYAQFASYFLSAGTINSRDVNAGGFQMVMLKGSGTACLEEAPCGGVGDWGTHPGSTSLYVNVGPVVSSIPYNYFGTYYSGGDIYANYAGETYNWSDGFPDTSANNFLFYFMPSNNPVSYVCIPSTSSTGAGTGTLTKYWGYTRVSPQPIPPTGYNYSSVVVQGVSACTFSVTAPANLTTATNPRFLSVYLQITDSNGQAGTLVQEIPLNNTY
jgi:prepilin-type N-terminal cleavage/methylation domain-containing protein